MSLKKSSSIQRAVWAAAARDLGVTSPDIPDSIDHIQGQINYPADLFTIGEPMPLFIAPWDGDVYFIALVVLRSISGGPSLVDFTIDGGASIGQLSTGAGTTGLKASLIISPPAPFAAGEVLEAISDAAATGQSSVAVFAGCRSAPV